MTQLYSRAARKATYRAAETVDKVKLLKQELKDSVLELKSRRWNSLPPQCGNADFVLSELKFMAQP